MKLWTCNEFDGHWPVGSAAVVIAENEKQACTLLEEALLADGLSQEIKPEMLKRVSIGKSCAIILCNGEY